MRKIVIIIFLSAIFVVNMFTYRYIAKNEAASDPEQSETIASSETTATQTETGTPSQTSGSGHMDLSCLIELIEKEIPYIPVFAPSPSLTTLPSLFLDDITNFGYVPDSSEIDFKTGSEYTKLQGIITFRGNNFRSQAAYGSVEVAENVLEVVWKYDIGYVDTWSGVGWTGQPLIVQWTDDLKQIMNIYDSKKAKKDLKEIIYATLDGRIYFLDLDDGLKTREPIDIGYPHKGTASLDPRGYPLLYAGQGINLVNGIRVELGFRIFSLIDQSLLFFLDGSDPDSKRDWFAFDSSAIIDAANDTVYEPGESGIFYKIKLNSIFDMQNGTISIDPEISKYRYEPTANFRQGIENSMAAYMNYGFFADNSGFIQCLDLETLEPVWANYLEEDTDASLVAETINGKLYLYAGSEVDFQGTSGIAYIRKIDGETGEFIWENEYFCGSNADVNGGAMATPVIGSGELEDYIFFNIAKIDSSNRSLLVALDKNTGEEIWRYIHNNYSWSSPIFINSTNGTYHILQCDSIGQMILFDARLGNVEYVLDLGSNIEGSPVLFNDMIVVGTRGQKIWGVRIK